MKKKTTTKLDNYKFNPSKLVDGTSFGMQTLVGYSSRTGFPIKNGGNCFSLKVGDKYLKIVNFGAENLAHLIEEKIIEWPVKILPLDDWCGVILDERVPENYYWSKFCSICCPFRMLPTTQKLEIWARQQRGDETVIKYNADGKTRYMTCYKYEQPTRKLESGRTVAVDPKINMINGIDIDAEVTNALVQGLTATKIRDTGYVYCPYSPKIKVDNPKK